MVVVESIKNMMENENVTYEYIYKVLESDYSSELNQRTVKSKAYGVEVERKDIVNGQVISTCKDFIKYISPKKERVAELVKFLKNNTVSPIHLVDVIEECIEGYISDFNEIN